MAEENNLTIQSVEVTSVSVEKTPIPKRTREYKPRVLIEKIPDIKPCPTCLKNVSLFKIGMDARPSMNESSDFFVSCTNPKCKRSSIAMRNINLTKAIEAWNSF